MYEKIWKAVRDHPLNLDNYRHQEIYARVYEIVNLSHPLRNIDEPHCPTMAYLFRKYKYNYARGMVMACFYLANNPEGTTYKCTVPFILAKKFLKIRYLGIL